jgi:hypothetical protein
LFFVGSTISTGKPNIRQPVPRQRLWDQSRDLSNGGFLAHRNSKESGNEQKTSASPTRVRAEKLVRDIRCAMRKHHFAGDNIRIVLEWLGSDEGIENTGK